MPCKSLKCLFQFEKIKKLSQISVVRLLIIELVYIISFFFLDNHIICVLLKTNGYYYLQELL